MTQISDSYLQNAAFMQFRYLLMALGIFLVLNASAPLSYSSGPFFVQDFGATPVNGSGIAATVSFSLVGLSAAPTLYIGGVDFKAGTLSCNVSYSSCNATVTFLPKSVGLRQDALLLKNSSGVLLASAFLHGVGTGPALHAFPATISTPAGSGVWGYSDGTASAASFRNPQGVAVDLQGNLYVADTINMVVRKVAAGSNTVSTVAGNGSSGYAGDNGLAINAKLNSPTGVAVDAAGNLFIADQQNGLIRRVDALTRIITTVAGGGSSLASGVAATVAALSGPDGVVVDPAGNLYISDSFHHLVREVIASTGVISTIAGGGSSSGSDGLGDGSTATSAHLNNPTGLALDSSGNLFIADTGDSLIRRVDAVTGIISAVAGTGSSGSSGDGGPAIAAELGSPMGIRVDAAGNLYIADFANNTVRMVSAQSGNIATIAGTGTATYTGNGGLATSATLSNPTDLVLDASGNLLIADNGNNVIRKLAFQPPTITFPSTNVSLTSALVYFQLQNFGNASLNFSSLSLSLPFHQQSSGGNDCSASSTLAAGAECSVDVYFTPTSNITFSGTLTATTNSNNQASTFTASLTGTGLSGTPIATVSPSSLTFGTTAVGSTSPAQTVTLKNTGTATLSSIAITLSGENPFDYKLTTTCASTLAANATCTASLTFVPLMAGSRSATLSIFNNGANSPQTLALNGLGAGGALPVLGPATLSFGSQFIATASSSFNATLTNVGTTALSIYGISIAGTNAGDFTLMSSTCPSSLAVSASCSVTVNFLPTASGTRTAELLVGDSAGNSPQTVTLTGIGLSLSLPVLNTTSLSFGSQPEYSAATPQVITLTSTASVPLGIAGANITGPAGSDFAINQFTCGSILAAASSCAITIGFAPTALGTRTATLQITYDTGDTQSTALSGTATSALAPASTQLSGFFDTSANTPLINYVGADSHVHQFYIGEGTWHDLDLTASTGAFDVASHSSLSGFFDANTSNPRINYVATDSHVHQIYRKSSVWFDFDLTAATGAVIPAVRTPISAFFDSLSTHPRINYVGSDSHIHQFYISNGAWHDFDITAATGAVAPLPGAAISGFFDSATNNPRINYVGVDLHVHQFFIRGGSWQDYDLTAATGALSPLGSSPICGFWDMASSHPRINYIAADSHIHQFFINEVWRDFDLTAATSTGFAAGVSISGFFDSNTNNPRINYLGLDTHIHQFYIANGAWHDFDLTVATGAVVALVGSPISGFVDPATNNRRINYIGNDAHIHQFYIASGAWHDYDLTAATGAVLPSS